MVNRNIACCLLQLIVLGKYDINRDGRSAMVAQLMKCRLSEALASVLVKRLPKGFF